MDTKPTNSSVREQTLAEELGKRQPFDLQEEELYVSMLRTCDRLSSQFQDVFAEHSLSESLYNALRIVAGEQKYTPDGITVGMISQRMVCRQPDTTRLIDRLETLGYVRRDKSEQDARRRMVRMTAKGAETLQALRRPVRELHRRNFHTLSEKDQIQLLRILEKVRHTLEEQ